MEAEHAIKTFDNALALGYCPEITNMDQGSQFTGKLWNDKLLAHNVKPSHTGVGRCIDNVRIERLWRSVKWENIFLHDYNQVSEVRKGLKQYLDHYNNARPHQALGYKVPSEFYFLKHNSLK